MPSSLTPESTTLPSLTAASIKNLERQIATINQWPKLEATYFLDDSTRDKKIQKEKALALVLTLKFYANPLGGYPIDQEAKTAFKNILDTLDNPLLLQPHLQLSDDEKKYLRELLRVKLDKLADEIIIENKIQPEDIQAAILKTAIVTIPSAPPLPPEEKTTLEQQWWNNLTTEDKQKIIIGHSKLNEDQKNHLNQRVYYCYQIHYHEHSPKNNILYYYQMCLINAELNYLALSTAINLSAVPMSGMLRITSVNPYAYTGRWGHYHHTTHRGFFFGGSGKKDAEVAAIIAFIAFATSAIIGATYSTKKAFNSIRNIFTGEKVLRSLYRLAGTAGGAYLGVFAGAALGAALGSVIPGVGTAIGAILGLAFGVGFGAGIGALLTKYSAKLLSYLIYKDELNPTNPDKWRLSKKRTEQMQQKGINIPAVKEAISRIKEEKNLLGSNASFFWTKERKEKNRLNAELKIIKKIDMQYPPRYQFFSPITPSAPPIELDTARPVFNYKRSYMR